MKNMDIYLKFKIKNLSLFPLLKMDFNYFDAFESVCATEVNSTRHRFLSKSKVFFLKKCYKKKRNNTEKYLNCLRAHIKCWVLVYATEFERITMQLLMAFGHTQTDLTHGFSE